jgi:hypothetical protein
MLQCHISSNINNLNELNKQFNWIPNEYSIRPDSQTLEQKKFYCDQILEKYGSFNEYIFENVFNSNLANKWVFRPAHFRYNIYHGTNHYVLWNIQQNLSYDYDNKIITNKIKEELDKICSSYDFVWYKNPKPTVMEYYHVQVFWIRIKQN